MPKTQTAQEIRPEMIALMAREHRLRTTLESLEASGHAAHLVGGSVRDVLMGRNVADFDISTGARPEDVARIFSERGFAVHPTGIEHGTLTVVVEGEPFEITTWRQDVETDGRRATIRYADSIEVDALRRDFTINALYADSCGTVFDPTGEGLSDLEERRVRFVGKPEDRIREDSLRILRFYRFSATHGAGLKSGPDLEACESLKDLVASLPRERISAEMLKLLVAPQAAGSLCSMMRSGLLRIIFPNFRINEDEIVQRMDRVALFERMNGLPSCAVRRISCLFDATPRDEMKLSRKQATWINQVLETEKNVLSDEELGYFYGESVSQDALARRFSRGDKDAASDKVWGDVQRGASMEFPIKARDLMDRFEGKELGLELKRLEAEWIKNGFPDIVYLKEETCEL